MPAQQIIKRIIFCALVGALFLIYPNKAWGQVRINEFSSATSDDWVELYNNSDDHVNLKTYTLIDGSDSGNTKSFDCVLEPRGYLIVAWSSKLNNGGDIIKLLNENRIIDCVTYDNGADKLCEEQTKVNLAKINEGEFGARVEDGIGAWQINTTDTKNGPNDGSEKNPESGCFAPSPSPSPSPSLSPSPSPSPTPSPSPSLIPSPKPSPSPTPSPSLDEEMEATESTATESGQVLGEENEPSGSGKSNNPFLPALILIGLGIGLLGGAGVVFLRGSKYNKVYDTPGKN